MEKVDILCLGLAEITDVTPLELEKCWLIDYVSLERLARREVRPNPSTLVVFFQCDEAIGEERCDAYLQDILLSYNFLNTYLTKIFVFLRKPKNINQKIISYFDDFIFLPCPAKEFQARIALKMDHFSTHKTKENIILGEFSAFNLKGTSELFTNTLRLIKTVAKCDASVLIEGETGTGKENAARAIHYLSSRQDNAFIPINCGAIPDNLLESEFFGHERGAFTDAKQKQEGLIAVANNGTLFLDEVDSLSFKAQAAMLRFLQTGEYRPVGSNKSVKSTARIIAATNAHLPDLVENKLFREDLYFRLNVLEVHMPALRERPEDISVIAIHLIEKYVQRHGSGPSHIYPSTLCWLEQQPWKGNVRELENILLRNFLLTESDYLEIRDNLSNGIPVLSKNETCSFQDAKEVAIVQFERSYIEHLLAATDGNISRAAKISGKERRALGKLIKKHAIDAREFKLHDCSA